METTETKEYIITSESSREIREEAIKSILTNNIGGLHFNSVTTMPLTETESAQTVRTFTANGSSVTVTEDAFVDFVDEYFRLKSEIEEEELQTILADAYEAQVKMKDMWENQGYEYPFNVE